MVLALLRRSRSAHHRSRLVEERPLGHSLDGYVKRLVAAYRHAVQEDLVRPHAVQRGAVYPRRAVLLRRQYAKLRRQTRRIVQHLRPILHHELRLAEVDVCGRCARPCVRDLQLDDLHAAKANLDGLCGFAVRNLSRCRKQPLVAVYVEDRFRVPARQGVDAKHDLKALCAAVRKELAPHRNVLRLQAKTVLVCDSAHIERRLPDAFFRPRTENVLRLGERIGVQVFEPQVRGERRKCGKQRHGQNYGTLHFPMISLNVGRTAFHQMR